MLTCISHSLHVQPNHQDSLSSEQLISLIRGFSVQPMLADFCKSEVERMLAERSEKMPIGQQKFGQPSLGQGQQPISPGGQAVGSIHQVDVLQDVDSAELDANTGAVVESLDS